MNTMRIFLVILTLIGIVHIVAIFLEKETLRHVTKILIVPSLLAAYICGAGNQPFFPIPALVLGWIGDILLIRIEKKRNFVLGLVSFLLGHLCYIIAFIGYLGFFGSGGATGKINIPAIAILGPPFIVLGIIIFRLIKPPKELSIPVMLYIAILITMSLFGFQVFLCNPGLAGLSIITGCLCFMISDTILAYYTFRKRNILGSAFVMFYYILAQAEIILGILSLKPGG